MISRINYKHNIKLYDKLYYSKMINGQSVDYVSGMHYGLCRMSFNGCEVIAVHNTLVYLKKPLPIYEISYYMERFRLLIGIFGCNPYKIGRALKHFGIDYRRSGQIGNSEIFILSFWTGKRFLSSIHTVFCVHRNDDIIVYNMYNNYPKEKIYQNSSVIAEQKKIIAVYNIKGA